jgi:hypothetical protein
MLTGCQYISVVNTKLRSERMLAQVKRIDHFAEQSTLAIALNELTQLNIHRLKVGGLGNDWKSSFRLKPLLLGFRRLKLLCAIGHSKIIFGRHLLLVDIRFDHFFRHCARCRTEITPCP